MDHFFQWQIRRTCFSLGLLLGLVFFSLPAALPSRTTAANTSIASWSTPLNLSEDSGRSTFPLLTEDPRSGDLFSVWTDRTTDPYGEIMARRRMAGSQKWTATENLSGRPTWDDGATMAVDPQGLLYLFWTQRSTQLGSDLLYRFWTGNEWSETKQLDHTATFHPSSYSLFFVHDPAGRLCLFVSIGSGVRSTCLDGTTWSPLTDWAFVPYVRRLGAIILGPDGLYHAAIYGHNDDGGDRGCDPFLDDVYYATTDGTTWNIQQNLSTLGSIAYDTNLAFDRQGRLHLFWSDIHPKCSYDSVKSAVYERILEGGTWGPRSEVTVDNDGQAVEDLALAGDPLGLRLAWSEGLFDDSGAAIYLAIHYRRWTGSAWSNEEVIDVNPDESINVDLLVDRQGRSAIAWEDGDFRAEEVYFSQRDPESWAVSLPDIRKASGDSGVR